MKKDEPPSIRIEDRGYETPCHIWQKHICKDGYGRTWNPLRKRSSTAHRAVYEGKHGPVPNTLDLDHLCRVRACVNDEHLEPVTRRVNARRGETGLHLAKLTEQAKRTIARCKEQPATSVAALYGVTVRRIYQIRSDSRYA